MHIESIAIKNFRIFKSLDLILNPGLNLLVGENDSGKTSLIDAIRYVLGTNSSERSFIDESDFHNHEQEFSIQLKFVDVEKHAHIFVEHLTYEKDKDDKSRSRAVLYVQFTAKNTGQEKRGYPFIVTELKSGKNGNGLSLESEIRTFLSTTYLKPLRDAEAELSSGRGSRLSQILNSSKDLLKPESINEILELIANANEKLVKEGSPIHRTSQKIRDDYLYQLIFEQDKKFLNAIINITGIKNITKLTDIEKRKHLRTILEGLNLSLTGKRKKHGLGYNNLLFIAAELLLLEQELNSEFPLLLIEEPEAHLHPQLQMKLLQFIINKAKTTENLQGIQCLLSTHSPNISSKADPKNIIILSQGKAFSLRPEETELEEDNYKFLRKFLDTTKANLFFARGVILVEGDAENILLPSIAKLIGRPLEDYGVSIINIGNTGWKHFAKLFLRKGSEVNPIKVSVLRDLDLWPACAEKNEITPTLYGFLKKKKPKDGKGGNLQYWLKEDIEEQKSQIEERILSLKKDKSTDPETLEKQNVSVKISDQWTFEFCLSYFGLFDECYEVVNDSICGKEKITGLEKDKATYIQKEVNKTDFALKLAIKLEKKYEGKPNDLKDKLPPYIISAIEHVTVSFTHNVEEGDSEVDHA
jgi:putative ATP-dependent endonuclease of OLD family